MTLKGRMQNDVMWTSSSCASDVESCWSRNRKHVNENRGVTVNENVASTRGPVTTWAGPFTAMRHGAPQICNSLPPSPSPTQEGSRDALPGLGCAHIHKNRRPCLPTDFRASSTAGSLPTSVGTHKEKGAMGWAVILC